MKQIQKDIGKKLFNHRHKYQITLKEVYENTGLSYDEIDNIELGLVNFEEEIFNKLLDFYDIDIKVDLV